jgi:3-oxoacyl-[acyl-carrier-protein] synthase II
MINAPPAQLVGLGAISPAGADVAALWTALFAAPQAPQREAVTGFPAGSRSLQHGYAAHLNNAVDAGMSRFDRLALCAADQAVADATLRGLNFDGLHIGLIVGTAAGQADLAEACRHSGDTATLQAHHAYSSIDQWAGLLPVAIDGPTLSISNACAAGLYALAHAAELLQDGQADAMLVLGIEVLSRVTQAGFQKMTALDADRCRPFDVARAGTVLGEGAAALLLVSDAVARQPGLRTYGSLLGAGFSCDAHHPTAPRPDGQGIRDAVQRAMQAAQRDADCIDLVLPHGTGTPLNDCIEGQMLAQLLGCRRDAVAVMPIKAHIGHCAGASGTFAVIAAAMALDRGQAPPVLHLTQAAADPACALTLGSAPRRLPAAGAGHALINAYGFGGNNVSVLLQGAAHA